MAPLKNFNCVIIVEPGFVIWLYAIADSQLFCIYSHLKPTCKRYQHLSMPKIQSVPSDCSLYSANFFLAYVLQSSSISFLCCFTVVSLCFQYFETWLPTESISNTGKQHTLPFVSQSLTRECQLSTTGRIFGTTGVEHVGHVEPISVFGQPT